MRSFGCVRCVRCVGNEMRHATAVESMKRAQLMWNVSHYFLLVFIRLLIFYFLQSDAKAGFLRSARDGHLEKILEHLKNNTDINTCNNVTSLTIIIHCIIFAWCNYSLFNICRVRVVLIYVKSSINMQTEWCWNVRETAFHRLITFSFSHL